MATENKQTKPIDYATIFASSTRSDPSTQERKATEAHTMVRRLISAANQHANKSLNTSTWPQVFYSAQQYTAHYQALNKKLQQAKKLYANNLDIKGELKISKCQTLLTEEWNDRTLEMQGYLKKYLNIVEKSQHQIDRFIMHNVTQTTLGKAIQKILLFKCSGIASEMANIYSNLVSHHRLTNNDWFLNALEKIKEKSNKLSESYTQLALKDTSERKQTINHSNLDKFFESSDQLNSQEKTIGFLKTDKSITSSFHKEMKQSVVKSRTKLFEDTLTDLIKQSKQVEIKIRSSIYRPDVTLKEINALKTTFSSHASNMTKIVSYIEQQQCIDMPDDIKESLKDLARLEKTLDFHMELITGDCSPHSPSPSPS